MSEDEKPAVDQSTASNSDPRTAEVLRALERARGTIARSDNQTVDRLPESLLLEVLGSEVRALREERSRATSFTDEAARRFVDSTRSLERVLLAPNDKLQVLQKGLDLGLRDLRGAADAVGRQAIAVAACQDQQRNQIAILTAILVLFLLVAVPFVWNAHRLAQSTHDILRQILENQTKAQSAKGARR